MELDVAPTLDAFVGLKLSFEDHLGRSVDLVTPDALKPRMRPNVEREALDVACVGDLVVGDESFSRFVAWEPRHVAREEYPRMAERSAIEAPGSSVGGERPKFIDDEHFGKRDSWTAAAARLQARPYSLSPAEASHLRWLDAFGQLIGKHRPALREHRVLRAAGWSATPRAGVRHAPHGPGAGGRDGRSSAVRAVGADRGQHRRVA